MCIRDSKDFVHRFDEHLQNSVTTLYVTLEDEPGVLSNLLTQLYKAGANIITVNQNIPVDGVAPVSLAVRLDSGRVSVDELIAMMPVSYTHLDVYKRQPSVRSCAAPTGCAGRTAR